VCSNNRCPNKHILGMGGAGSCGGAGECSAGPCPAGDAAWAPCDATLPHAAVGPTQRLPRHRGTPLHCTP
jgi:hypothetical protein